MQKPRRPVKNSIVSDRRTKQRSAPVVSARAGAEQGTIATTFHSKHTLAAREPPQVSTRLGPNIPGPCPQQNGVGPTSSKRSGAAEPIFPDAIEIRTKKIINRAASLMRLPVAPSPSKGLPAAWPPAIWRLNAPVPPKKSLQWTGSRDATATENKGKRRNHAQKSSFGCRAPRRLL